MHGVDVMQVVANIESGDRSVCSWLQASSMFSLAISMSAIQDACTVCLHSVSVLYTGTICLQSIFASSYSCSTVADVGKKMVVDHTAAQFFKAAPRRILLSRSHVRQFVYAVVICATAPRPELLLFS